MGHRRKILHLMGSGGVGGREKQLYLVLRSHVSKNRDDVSVLFQNPVGRYYEALCHMSDLKVDSLPKTSDLSLGSMRRCFSMARKADLIFLHSPRTAFMAPMLFLDRPLIYRLSGMQLDRPCLQRIFKRPGRLLDRDGRSRDGENDRGARRSLFLVRAERWVRWTLFRRMMVHRADRVLVNSHFLYEKAVEKYGVPENKLRLVRTGIDPAFEQARFDSAIPLKTEEGEFTIAFIGRLDLRKRLDRLLHAVHDLERDGRSVRLLVAGDGGLRNDLQLMALSLGLNGRVGFLGHRENPYEVLKVSDLFVLPSDNEAFSNAVLEAMFAQVPIVLFAGGCGNGEVIAHGEDGFIVSSVNELVQLIKELMQNEPYRRAVGRKGKEALFRKGLSIEDYLGGLAGVMEEVLTEA